MEDSKSEHFGYFLSNITLTTAKNSLTNNTLVTDRLCQVLLIRKKLGKLGDFFREKDMRNMCVLKAKLHETIRNIRNSMLQKNSKFILCSPVARHHSMKYLCNFIRNDWFGIKIGKKYLHDWQHKAICFPKKFHHIWKISKNNFHKNVEICQKQILKQVYKLFFC